jgi:hypothetical protein
MRDGLLVRKPEWFDCGEVNRTAMGEDAAYEFDVDVTLLDTVFEWAHEVATEYEASQVS